MLAQRVTLFGLPTAVALFVGCATSGSPSIPPFIEQGTQEIKQAEVSVPSPVIQPVSHLEEELTWPVTQVNAAPQTSLRQLEALALQQNPRLVRLSQQYQAAIAKSRYADKLPDPKFGANVFGNAIETASGSQRANMTFSQAIPWLGRLSAEEQRAIFEAYAVHAELEAERLRVVAQIRSNWHRLYVVDRQIEIAKANQQLLHSLIDLANARVATGGAAQGDVLLGTVELSQLEERLLLYYRQRLGVEAEINRLTSRSAEESIAGESELDGAMPKISVEEIVQLAERNQPELEAARLRTQATRWGIEVARLMRRPDFMISASYFPTDDNRPPSTIVDVGQDPWALGAQMSIPIWREKYDAIENEARWKHQAAHASVEEVADRYESLVVDLYAEAKRSEETVTLYEETILPQARQTLTADQDSYSNGSVDFDRVIRDYRNLLTLELGLHQAKGDLAIAVAKLQQAAGTDFTQSSR